MVTPRIGQMVRYVKRNEQLASYRMKDGSIYRVPERNVDLGVTGKVYSVGTVVWSVDAEHLSKTVIYVHVPYRDGHMMGAAFWSDELEDFNG